ncbi:putative MFS multidrug transporter [Setomelanomma holmii]|uniref:MFS multidrug transporter n=1 Tax=Setomelanomma holmii TaxID=210430 RepID=A0A9P4H7Y2_9PLEO|nr:putative MFS multidrug transporter [Setomelanomma holmii]
MEDSKNDSKRLEDPISIAQSGGVSKDERSHTVPTGNPSSTRPRKKELPLSGKTCREDASQEEKQTYVTGWKLFSLMFALITSVFVVLLDMIIIVTAIPKITSTFHSLSDVGWYGAAYNLASSALQPLAGKFYTYFQTKWTFLTYLFVFEVGSLVCALATSSSMFIAGRVVAGIGSSGLQSGAFSIISDAAPLAKQPFLIGTTMALVQLATASGPLVGGALTEYASWRWCFYINLPIGAVAAALILLIGIPDRRQSTGSKAVKAVIAEYDVYGFLFFVPTLVMLLLAFEWGGSKFPFKSATIIGLFLGGGITAVLFIIWESRQGQHAMIPLHIIRKRQNYSACVIMLTLLGTVFIASYYLPIYFQSVKGASPFKAGADMLYAIITQIVIALVSGVLCQKVGYYLPFAVASAVLLCIGNGLFTTFSVHTITAEWAGYQVLIGVGRGIGMQVPMIVVQANTPRQFIPPAMAFLTFCQTFGGAVFLAVANAIFNNQLQNGLEKIPDLDSDKIIRAGAFGIREAVPADKLEPVLESYADGVDSVFYLALAQAIVCLVFSCMVGWKDIRKEETSEEDKQT